MIHPNNPSAVRVKRDGPRGWHWVAKFDPAIHERYDAPANAPAPSSDAPKRGRQKKETGQ
jgi:hypothetical protein